jgi:long-chain acyl-CoA synthetase
MGLVPRYKKRIRALDFLLGILPFLLLYPLKALGSVLVFKTIKEKLGGRFVAGISGGGGLPAHVDAFFQAAGILLLEGYGLTESAPVLSLRPQKRPIPGTIGPAFPGTELKIIGEDGTELGPNQRGVLLARGPQIMKGYYRKDELTAQAIDADGFLNTGDLAIKTYDGEYAIVGRAKDTIVLLGGENIEPSPIEDKLKLSPYISTAVVLGQDRKFLTALILPDIDNVLTWAKDNAVPYADEETLLTGVEVHELLAGEISGLISSKNGFKIFERIVRFTVLPNPFEIGRELSAKQEIKRHVINEIYAKDIKTLYS